jgi:predicted dinucleotide-binding enzyme/putative intracellular protease/amidase
MSSPRVLLVVANPSVSTTLGWPVGFWAAEVIHPYHMFTSAGCAVTLASPDGGEVRLDAYSDPRDASGYSKEDHLSLEYLERPEFAALLGRTVPLGQVKAAEYDAVLVAGGQSPMFTFRGNTRLLTLFREFLDAGKPAAALCHGTCLLLDLRNADGTPFIRGRRMTGFANSEEDYADQAVGRKVMPFRIEDEAVALGAAFVAGPPFAPHVVVDGNLITGQQQNSGEVTARRVLEGLVSGGRARPGKIAFLGIGQVGGALAAGLARAGHSVLIAARDVQSPSVKAALAREPRLRALPTEQAVKEADLVFLATPYAAAAAAVAPLAGVLAGKILVDCTNPVGPGLTHGLESRRSGSEVVQEAAPAARVVKAFTVYGFENFENSSYPGYGSLRPTMPMAGDDVLAKGVVGRLCEVLGWEPVDVGPLSSALHLEHQTLLWIKMARVQGEGSGFVWARLRRAGPSAAAGA